MAPTIKDRRTPRVTIADLRRDLREADRRAYALCTGPRLLPRTSARSRTAPVLLAVTLSSVLASAAWAAREASADRLAHDVSVEIQTVPAAEIFDVRLEPIQVSGEAPAAEAEAVELGISPKPEARGPRVSGQAPAATRPAPRRPRPLSPGEFGRETD
jgi:hypothetical protein